MKLAVDERNVANRQLSYFFRLCLRILLLTFKVTSKMNVFKLSLWTMSWPKSII